MKNILAENLLRFGLKNADATVVNKLQSLAEQAGIPADVMQKIKKIEPVLATLITTKTEAPNVPTAYLGNNFVIEYDPGDQGESDGTGNKFDYGTYNLYEVGTYSGLPWISWKANYIMRGNGRGDLSFDVYDRGRIAWKSIDGNTTTEKLNNIWNEGNIPQEVIKKAFEYIQKNQAKFKTAFHKFTRSEYAIKNYWNGFQYDFFMDKLKRTAKLVIDLVQDDELIDHIEFKKENPRSDGKYPELKIPAAV